MNKLREGLALATEEELEVLVELLFRPRFNPLDYVQASSPETIQQLPYWQRLRAIEERLCFLAADGVTTLRGRSRQLPYHTILYQTCQYLKIPEAEVLSTEDLEAELFLQVFQSTLKRLPGSERSHLKRQIETALHSTPESRGLRHLLDNDRLRLTLEGGSALALSAVVRPLVLKHIARQVMIHMAKRQVARETLKQGGAAAARVQSYLATQMATRGVAVNLARYGAARSILGVVGPALWAWFLADLGWRTIATNHARTIPALFLLAQIRLTRVESSSARAS